MNKTLIEVKNIKKYFFHKKKIIKAVNNINFYIKKGDTLALVGESGCGKSTVAKLLAKLIIPDFGEILFKNKNIFEIKEKNFKIFRKKIQIIFQDPCASLNPRMSVKEILEEPQKIHRGKNSIKIQKLLDLVHMPFSCLKKFPHEFSTGQKQRIGIARALVLNPQFLILDEPTSALDVSIQAQIINLLKDLQQKFSLTYFFITHNLALAKYIATDIAVMHFGEIVEIGKCENIFKYPKHPYTKALLKAAISLEKRESLSINFSKNNLKSIFTKKCLNNKYSINPKIACRMPK